MRLRGVVIAFLGAEDSARELGKKGTSTDIAFFNSKRGDRAYTILLPARYPEKPQPLAHILGVAHHIVLEVTELGPELGEQVIAIQHSGHKHVWLILRNYLTEEQLAPLLKDAGLDYTLTDEKEFRESMESLESPGEDGKGHTIVDQAFNVKGVGTVVLGFVEGGGVAKHDETLISPGEKKAIIRSIQVQDDDHDEVGPGTRVGLALRGVDAEDLTKGSILGPAVLDVVQKAVLDIELSKYWKGKLEEGVILHLASSFQFAPARVEKILEGGGVEILLERPFLDHKKRVLLFQLDSGKQRVAGSARLTPL